MLTASIHLYYKNPAVSSVVAVYLRRWGSIRRLCHNDTMRPITGVTRITSDSNARRSIVVTRRCPCIRSSLLYFPRSSVAEVVWAVHWSVVGSVRDIGLRYLGGSVGRHRHAVLGVAIEGGRAPSHHHPCEEGGFRVTSLWKKASTW